MAFPSEVYIMVFFHLSDGPTRLALRATSATILGAAELARTTVEATVERINGRPCDNGPFYMMMMWHCPWVNHRVIRAPPASHGPFAAARYLMLVNERCGDPLALRNRRIYWNPLALGNLATDNTGGPLALGHIRIYGTGTDEIFHTVHLEIDGWRFGFHGVYDVWIGM